MTKNNQYPPIITLPPKLIRKIAAGQVIQRPASVVKELVDNALDAEATVIQIELLQAGKKMVKVTDNGRGMNRADLANSILPHATSKLTPASDLTDISSFGFRGEALASLVAVAQVQIATREKDQKVGSVLQSLPGQEPTIKASGLPIGTQVTVNKLFQTVPARLKHLASDRTELHHVERLLVHYAAAFPNVEWLVKHNGQLLFHLTPNDSLAKRASKILGLAEEEQLPFSFEHDLFLVQGVLSLPSQTVNHNRNLLLSINHRPVKAPKLEQVFKQAYVHLTDEAQFPQGVVNLTLPTTEIDVNVDPQKWSISISNQDQVLVALSEALEKALHRHADYPQLAETKPWMLRDGAAPHLLQRLKKAQKAWETSQTRQQTDVFQLDDTYLLHQTNTGDLIITDQHAAHERILYEQFLEVFEHDKKTAPTTQVSAPIAIRLSLSDIELLHHHLSTFEELGFSLHQTGPNVVQVIQIPEYLDEKLVQNVIQGVLEDLFNEVPVKAVESVAKKTIAYVACRSAVKAGDTLSLAERKNLLYQLAQTKSPFTCPHGRPIQISMTIKELEKKFKRT